MGAVGPAGSEGSQVDTIYLFVCLFVCMFTVALVILVFYIYPIF